MMNDDDDDDEDEDEDDGDDDEVWKSGLDLGVCNGSTSRSTDDFHL